MPRVPILASLLAGLLFASCAGQEQQVLDTFFTAVQGGDEATRTSVSIVDFPGEEVASWEIVEVGEESTEPFRLAEIREKLVEARKELEAIQEENDAFVREHQDAYIEWKEKTEEDPEAELSGDLAEFAAEWEPRWEKQSALIEARAELDEQMERLRQAASKSINATSVGSSYEGDVKGKELQLKVNDGSSDKMYTVRLERYELSDTETNITPMARWVITHIEEQGA